MLHRRLTGWPPATGYQVQMFDIAAGRLDPANLVDRASPARVMRGSRQSSVVSEDGSFVYSVYPDSSRGAFVHALAIGAGEPYAFSVDLPPTPGSGLWSLNLGRQGSAGYLFASNLGSGLVVELKLGEPPRVTRTLRLSQPSANRSWFVTQAQAKDELGGLGSTALTTHGKSLYVAFGEVVHVVDTTSMRGQTRLLEGRRVTSIALNPDGTSLYATTRGSDVVRVDPRSGQVAGQVTISAAYLTLLRVTVTG